MEASQQTLKNLADLDFAGRGEAFVEARFITPMLECLGYDGDKDYEVIRHGDSGASFKLHYPPVERGAVKVKHYNPDFIPTIRKKTFWIIEAKSPKEVNYPFDSAYLVQGLQYCIHPEIQAKYLLISNGVNSVVYDAHGSVFFGRDIYQPILEFKATEIHTRWAEIYNLLSSEKLRMRLEDDLKAMYDKLSLSSLNKEYPGQLIKRIGVLQHQHSKDIERHVLRLRGDASDKRTAAWRANIDESSIDEIFLQMDYPLRAGEYEGQHFVMRSLKEGWRSDEVFEKLTGDFSEQSIFRKEQTFGALCVLWQKTDDAENWSKIFRFLDQWKDAELPLLNQVECAFLRYVRKCAISKTYPEIRVKIDRQLASAPEIERYVHVPTALSATYGEEVMLHQRMFQIFKKLPVATLEELLVSVNAHEAEIEIEFKKAHASLTAMEKHIGGFEWYGLEGKHYAFKNMMENYKIASESEAQ